jgi:(2Fe-2S) ferredoxin
MGKHDKDLSKVEQLIRRNEACLAICVGKHCAKAGAKQVIRAARAALDETGLAGTYPVVLTKCQDYCDDGPVMAVIPGEYPYLGLCDHTARQVIFDHVRDHSPVLELLPKRIRRKLERRQT